MSQVNHSGIELIYDKKKQKAGSVHPLARVLFRYYNYSIQAYIHQPLP